MRLEARQKRKKRSIITTRQSTQTPRSLFNQDFYSSTRNIKFQLKYAMFSVSKLFDYAKKLKADDCQRQLIKYITENRKKFLSTLPVRETSNYEKNCKKKIAQFVKRICNALFDKLRLGSLLESAKLYHHLLDTLEQSEGNYLNFVDKYKFTELRKNLRSFKKS